jgi:hypothetical protein
MPLGKKEEIHSVLEILPDRKDFETNLYARFLTPNMMYVGVTLKPLAIRDKL